MRSNKKVTLALGIMSGMTFMGIIGSTAGTLAWYAYYTRTTTAFRGTSVRSSEQLQVGLVANTGSDYLLSIPDSKLAELELTKESDKDGKTIYWSNTGAGLTAATIGEYLSGSKFATNKLSPVTSRDRTLTDEISLYRAPQHGDAVLDTSAATENYVHIELAFRIKDANMNTVHGNHVWITETLAQASVGENVEKAIRVYVEDKSTESASLATPFFLLNPSSELEGTGTTKVAGLLDLNGKGVYDTFFDGKEIVYGDYTMPGGSLVYGGTPYVEPANPEDYVADNVNGVTDTSELSTFLAKHRAGAYLVDTSSFVAKTATYDTLYTIKPSENMSTGKYNEDSGKAVTCTDSANDIGYANLTIYLEGWDHVVIDKIDGYQFNLGIQFEINRS